MRAGEEMSNKDKGGPDWEKVAAGKVRGKVAGMGKGAEGKEKGEAQRLKVSDIKRAQETLSTMSPSQMIGMLGVPKSALTPKQRAFAYNVAMGASKAESYRRAYKQDASKHTLSSKPYHLAADDRIAAEIAAYRLAAEAAKHRTPADLRNLVIQTLVSQVIDPDTPPAIRTQAVKTLGQVTEVAAFTERKESIVHHSSDKLRADIMAQVQALMSGTTIEGERIEQDAASLMAELASPPPEIDPHGPSLDAQGDTPNDTHNAK